MDISKYNLSSRLSLLLCMLALVISSTGYADQIHMNNGDIITGELTKVSGGKAYIKPSYSDEFAVNMADVSSIEASNKLEAELEDGSIVTEAQLDLNSAGQQVLIVDGNEQPLSLTGLKQFSPPTPYYERVSHADVNLIYNSGNTDSQSALVFIDTMLRLGDHRHLGSVSISRDETNGTSTKKQDLVNYEYNWVFSEPWYTGVTASYERDPIRDLSHRYTIGAIFGRDLINHDGQFLTFNFGFGFSDETINRQNNSGSVGLWSLIYQQDLFSGKAKFFHDDKLTYQFFDENNTIFKSNTGIQFDLVKNIYAKASFRYDYETEPAPGTSKDDTTLAIGVGAEF